MASAQNRPAGRRYPLEQFRKEMLDCMCVLKSIELDYWLDYGTLLGARRDGGFIAWDNDIDLGIFAGEVERLRQIRKPLKNAGFTMRTISYRGKMLQLQLARNGPPINFSIYHEDGNCYWTLWLVPRSRLSAINHGALHRDDLFGSLYSSLVKMGRRVIPKHLVSRLFGDKIVKIKVPRSFFDQRGTLDFIDETFSTPLEIDAYLEMRYGEDWQTPRKNWVYWQDDGAIAGPNPHHLK